MKKILVLAAALSILSLSVHAEGQMRWRCAETGKNSMQCQFQNNSDRDAEACFDVVKVCNDGHHIAPLCSGRLRPGESDLKVIASFDPKVHLLTKCVGIEYQNRVMQ